MSFPDAYYTVGSLFNRDGAIKPYKLCFHLIRLGVWRLTLCRPTISKINKQMIAPHITVWSFLLSFLGWRVGFSAKRRLDRGLKYTHAGECPGSDRNTMSSRNEPLDLGPLRTEVGAEVLSKKSLQARYNMQHSVTCCHQKRRQCNGDCMTGEK
jgi:hypothetical protein